jgi:hypothetical protein
VKRCNPYGYATDAGPRHLMGGFYGPEYAGDQTVLKDGIHGPAVCERDATVRARMVCELGHEGPVMDLCLGHVRELSARMSDCCTRCVWPGEARGVNEAMDYIMIRMAEARERRDIVTLRKLNDQLDDQRHQMDELRARGIIRKVPLRLVEISLWQRRQRTCGRGSASRATT